MGKLTYEEQELILAYIDDLENFKINQSFEIKKEFSKTAKDIILALDALRFRTLVYRSEIIKNNKSTQREVANLTHDLKTPLAIISASCECLEDGMNDKNYIEIIKHKVDELNQKVLRIIDSSNPIINAENDNKIYINTKDFLTPIFKKYEFLIKGKKNRYIIKRIPNVAIVANENQLISVIDNLITNAIKHTEKGKISILFKATHHTFSLTVKDSGKGISKDELPFIFDRFYSSDKARTQGSSGIGLNYVKKTIEEHGGNIKVESKLNKGTKFIVSLPRVDAIKKRLSPNTKKFIEACLRVFMFPFFIVIDILRIFYYGAISLIKE